MCWAVALRDEEEEEHLEKRAGCERGWSEEEIGVPEVSGQVRAERVRWE